MGYTLKAFIGHTESLVLILENYNESKKVDLKHGISIIPMTDRLFDEMNEVKSSTAISNFELLTESVEGKVLQLIAGRELAYVESEFHGGQGGHIGVLWNNGKRNLLTKFDKSSMNIILKTLGVKGTLSKDEFQTVGLETNRDTGDWVK